jgi:hypothetical protein
MGIDDMAKISAQDAAGQVKEAVGGATGNDDLRPQEKPTKSRPASNRPARRSKTPSLTSWQVSGGAEVTHRR